jgi:hypothetical protein
MYKIYPSWDFWYENKPSGNPGNGRFTTVEEGSAENYANGFLFQLDILLFRNDVSGWRGRRVTWRMKEKKMTFWIKNVARIVEF